MRQKLRMIISHASGGHLSEPGDVDRSVNDICVEISRHKNDIWAHAQESALKARPEAVTDELMRDAVIAAYIEGATTVHKWWADADAVERQFAEREAGPDFTEAAHDYATDALSKVSPLIVGGK